MQPLAMPNILPRLPLFAVGAAMSAALVIAAIGPAAFGGYTQPPPSAIVAERTLRFADRADHAVLVTENGQQVAVFEGEQGFIRGILRSFARTRRSEGVGAAQPFHLVAWADGRLTFDDPSTGVKLDLDAYGPDNAAVFATLLPKIAR